MWVYRSAESSATPVVLFEYQAGRGQQHPQAFLQGFTGTLMTDGYSAWRTLDGVRHVGRFAHARRYFDEAAKAQGKADSRARQALDMIGRLYQVEALAKGELPAGRSRVEYTYTVRQQDSLPVLAAFKTWLDEHAVTVLPKSLLGTAITYARNQWLYMSRYADDGNAPIDNNLIERDIRPFTTGRKNWLFSATVAGAQASAVIKGARRIGHAPYGHWKTTTFLCGLRSVGLVAPLIIDGPINGELFRAWVEQMLVPVLQPDDMVVLDNLRSHKVAGIEEAICAAGAHLLYLPPYSPDYNPIEQVFSKLKTLLRKTAARTVDALWSAIGELIGQFAPNECVQYIRHAGNSRSA